MKPFLRLFLPVLVVALAACQGPSVNGPDIDDNGPDDDPQPLTGAITGTLTDSSGAPLAYAEVELGYAGITVAALEPASAQVYATDAHGQFAFDVNEAGDYTLTWMHPTKPEGALRRVTVNRDADGNLSSSPITMQAAELGRVAGRVVTRGAEPWAFLLGTSFLAPADPNGDFLISRVPAGNYLLAPGLLGVRGKAVEVTVEPGAITTVSELLEFGPVIDSVNPGGFQAADDYVNPGDTIFSIRGSGFGNSMGVSQLRYGSLPVNGYVTSWSDEEIVVRMFATALHASAMHEDLRFTLSAISGEARSERVGVVYGSVYSGTCNDDWDPENTWIRAGAFSFGLPVGGAPVEFAIENGVARSTPGAPAGTIFLADTDGCVNVVVEPEPASTPVMVVTASYEGVELHGTVAIATVELQLDSPVYYHEYADDNVTVTGQLINSRNGAAITGTGFVAGVDMDYSDFTYGYETPLTLDADGRFSISVPIELMTTNYPQLDILYSGVSIASQGFEFEPIHTISAAVTSSDPVRTVEIEPGTRMTFLLNVDEATAASGPALYIELNNWLPLQVDWQGERYYSEDHFMFEANSISGFSTSSLSTMGIGVETACRGSCVILDSQAGTAYVRVENRNYESVSLDLYVFTDVLQDTGEPANDTRDGATIIDASNPEESGALETVHDVDYFLVGGPEGLPVAIDFFSAGFPAVMWVETASGEFKAGPFYNGETASVVGGDYLRIEADGPFAAPSAESAYYLSSIW